MGAKPWAAGIAIAFLGAAGGCTREDTDSVEPSTHGEVQGERGTSSVNIGMGGFGGGSGGIPEDGHHEGRRGEGKLHAPKVERGLIGNVSATALDDDDDDDDDDGDVLPGLGDLEVVTAPVLPGDPSTDASIATALCSEDDVVVSGGCDCNGQVLIGSRMEDRGWSCACMSGAGQTAFSVCADEEVTVTSVPVKFPEHAGANADVSCPTGTHLVAAGAHCGFSGQTGQRGPTGKHGLAQSVIPTDTARVVGRCASTVSGGGTEATLYGYCLADATPNVRLTPVSNANRSECDEQSVVIGGGCRCHDPDRGPLQSAYMGGNSFVCSCKNGTANETVALCMQR
jgi:hypothetical protein